MDNRRIIYVWNYREWGGAQIYYLSLMKAAQAGYSISVIIPSDSDPKILQYLGSMGVAVEFTDPALPPVSPPGFFKKISHRFSVFLSEHRLADRILSRDGLEDTIVHIDLGFWLSFRALRRLCQRTTVFVTQHTALTDPGGIRGALWRRNGKRMSRLPNFIVLASNNIAKTSLQKFLSREKFDSIRVTYTGLEPDEFEGLVDPRISRDAVFERYSLVHGRPLLITVGQFVERKGCWVVLDSLKQLRDQGEEFQFLWLGTSELDNTTLDRIYAYSLGADFRFFSAAVIGATRHNLLGLLGIADIFVLASLIEGLPIALVEAMGLGLPCVASNVGAIPEAIDDDVSGLLVPPGDAAKLTHAIRSLMHDEESRRMFGTAAKAIAFEKFNQKTTAEETVRIYDNVWKTNG